MRRGAAMGIRLGTAAGGTLPDGLVSMATEAVAVVTGGGDVTAGEVAVAALLGPTLLVTAPLQVATEAALLGGATVVAPLVGATKVTPLGGATAVAPLGGGTGVASLGGGSEAVPPEGAIAVALDRGPEVLTVPSPHSVSLPIIRQPLLNDTQISGELPNHRQGVRTTAGGRYRVRTTRQAVRTTARGRYKVRTTARRRHRQARRKLMGRGALNRRCCCCYLGNDRSWRQGATWCRSRRNGRTL